MVSEDRVGHELTHGIPISKVVRTSVDCTNCHRHFIALLDFRVDGNHIIECPFCFHEHCRTIRNGIVTGDRWDSREQRVQAEIDKMKDSSTWKPDSRPIQTTSAAGFLRRKWLERWER